MRCRAKINSLGGKQRECEIEFDGDLVIDGNLFIVCNDTHENRGVFFTRTGLIEGTFAHLFCQSVNNKIVLNATNVSVTPNGGVLQLGGNGTLALLNIQRIAPGETPGDVSSSGIMYFSFGKRKVDGTIEFHEVGLRATLGAGSADPHLEVLYPVFVGSTVDPTVLGRISLEE